MITAQCTLVYSGCHPAIVTVSTCQPHMEKFRSSKMFISSYVTIIVCYESHHLFQEKIDTMRLSASFLLIAAAILSIIRGKKQTLPFFSKGADLRLC